MNILEKEIIATLAFFNTFEKALTVEELFENLYRENLTSANRSEEELMNALKSLEAGSIIETSEREEGIAIRLKGTATKDRTEYNKKLIAKTNRWSWVFKLCPFLELVGVCNTLGFNAAKEGSDIDLFIVTGGGRLFTGRTFVTLITHMLGLRRHGNKIKERFCLSFMVDAADQDVHRLAFEEDVYFTYWLKNLRIVYARNTDSIEDLAANNKYWVSQYLHNPNFNTEKVRQGKFVISKMIEFLLTGIIGNSIEKSLRTWQLKRARRKASELPDLSGTVLTETTLKFHDIDKRRAIHTKWQKDKQSSHSKDHEFSTF
ncbi:MAG: hypothetical protein Q8P68_02825 [Candidatus Peregrinibacteria bacterium]|nr:hypothetical protein [Candidatus Peregrinibacteria bacterium]MDZ4245229.1 hypothetical protein [Candidatus Gracilibacteria bacterium]